MGLALDCRILCSASGVLKVYYHLVLVGHILLSPRGHPTRLLGFCEKTNGDRIGLYGDFGLLSRFRERCYYFHAGFCGFAG